MIVKVKSTTGPVRVGPGTLVNSGPDPVAYAPSTDVDRPATLDPGDKLGIAGGFVATAGKAQLALKSRAEDIQAATVAAIEAARESGREPSDTELARIRAKAEHDWAPSK